MRHIRGGKKGRLLLDMDPGDEDVDDLTGTWFADNPMKVVRDQSVDMILILFFGLLGVGCIIAYYILDGLINIIKMNKESKLI